MRPTLDKANYYLHIMKSYHDHFIEQVDSLVDTGVSSVMNTVDTIIVRIFRTIWDATEGLLQCLRITKAVFDEFAVEDQSPASYNRLKVQGNVLMLCAVIGSFERPKGVLSCFRSLRRHLCEFFSWSHRYFHALANNNGQAACLVCYCSETLAQYRMLSERG